MKVFTMIPTYNERENVPLLVERIKRLGIQGMEIAVVDDNSPDGTADCVKDMMKTAMENGEIPGPPDQPKEITPAMREKMKENDELMRIVNDLSGKYGGEAKVLVSIVDGEETVFQALIIVNPDIVLDFKPSTTITETPDVTMTMSFDFMYDMIMFEEKQVSGGETEVPPWEPRPSKGFKGFVDQATMFTKVMGGVTTGQIKVGPFGEMQNVMTLMKFVMGGSGGDRPEEEMMERPDKETMGLVEEGMGKSPEGGMMEGFKEGMENPPEEGMMKPYEEGMGEGKGEFGKII